MISARIVYRCLLVGATVPVVLIALSSLYWPMGRDQGIFAWTADGLLHGQAPYRDAWEAKGPATFWIYAATQATLGRNFWGIRVVDLLLLSLMLAAVWKLLRLRTGRMIAWSGVLLSALYYYGFQYQDTAQPDGWAGMCLIVAFALVANTTSRASVWQALAAGGLIGMAASFKFFFLALLAPVLLLAWLNAPATSDRRGKVVNSLLIVTAAVGLAGLGLLILMLQGALGEYWSIQFEFNRSVHAMLREARLREISNAIFRFAAWLQIWWFALLLRPARSGRSASALWASCWLAFVILVGLVIAQNKFYPYHWIPATFVLVLLIGLGLGRILDYFAEKDSPAILESNNRSGYLPACWLLGLVLTAEVIWLFGGRGPDVIAVARYITGNITADEFHHSFGKYDEGDFSLAADLEVAAYVQAHTSRHDMVLVWGFEPLINFLADRRTPTRFGYNYPIVASVGTPLHERYVAELLADLEQNRPLYIIVADHDGENLLRVSSKAALEKIPAIKNFIERNYTPEKTIEHFDLWRRTADD